MSGIAENEFDENFILERIRHILLWARFIQRDSVMQKFAVYIAELLKWNSKINLTAAASLDDLIEKQLFDSCIPLKLGSELIRNNSVLLDIGSGGGFPAIPLKIMKGSLKVHMVESRLKKVNFLKHVARKLDLKEMTVWNSRFPFESTGREAEYFPERFDVITSKAVKPDKKICSAITEYLDGQGIAIFYRAFNDEDVAIAEKYGLEISEEITYRLPVTRAKRTMTVLKIKIQLV